MLSRTNIKTPLKLVDGAKKRSFINRRKKLLCTLLVLKLNDNHARVDFLKYNRIQKANFRHA